MTHDLKAIGRRIATVRREMNLSQKDLAAKINISTTTCRILRQGSLHRALQHFLTYAPSSMPMLLI